MKTEAYTKYFIQPSVKQIIHLINYRPPPVRANHTGTPYGYICSGGMRIFFIYMHLFLWKNIFSRI